MSKSGKNDINEQLDELAIRMLELMNEQIECKMNLERLIKTGSLDLAKSRYIMGNNSVSALQFPTDDITPQATVESSTKENKVTFQLNRVTPDTKKPSELETESEKNKITPQDPLKWFGLLVPQNLRQGQSSFQKAVDISVQSANVATEIDSCHNQYKKLFIEKSKEQYNTIES